MSYMYECNECNVLFELEYFFFNFNKYTVVCTVTVHVTIINIFFYFIFFNKIKNLNYFFKKVLCSTDTRVYNYWCTWSGCKKPVQYNCTTIFIHLVYACTVCTVMYVM